ncbi:hypothetical protein LTR56_004739 [Elasticomyces elasticus]|nr:hypothetical protein LTR56_004739 [Elasticomyces elasticus]KAK3665594.1 hypothetical protein LTR22_003534 [Elasticomyces elasticus]KAK4930368.1 hypothetical protein LTR49_003109 [Elasticomyces elasticus]KAK5768905.1 hypothetical protein LTS12_000965 [Elasticomyces elasticus]
MTDTRDAPPAYSAFDLAQKAPDSSQDSAVVSNTYEIYNTTTGLDVTNSGRQIYYLGRYDAPTSPDILAYGGYDHNGPWLAQADFRLFEKSLRVYLGGLKHPAKDDWDIVRHSTKGHIFLTDFFRFEVIDQFSTKRKLHWTKTRDRKLGASRLSIRDHKLVDEGSEEIVAVYTEHNLGMADTLKGRLVFHQRLGDNAELAALVVVIAINERLRRYTKQIAVAFSTAGGGGAA